MREKTEKVNIGDIAKMAGVSKAAVSRYFNHGYISDEKRELIRKVVEETGYQPSIQAAHLRIKKTNTVGVIVPKLSSYSIGKLVDGLLTVFNENKYYTLLAVTQNDPEKELEYLHAFQNHSVDGVILMGTVLTPKHKELIRDLQVPVVITGQHFNGFNCVYNDDYNAMYEITKKVLEKGRKKPVYIGVTQRDVAVCKERFEGFRDALKEYDLEHLATRSVICSGFDEQAGYDATEELYKLYPDMDATICATDTLAFGASRYLELAGISLPGQVLVSGIGGSTLALHAGYPILTAKYYYQQAGKISSKLLLDMMNGAVTVQSNMKLGFDIIDDINR